MCLIKTLTRTIMFENDEVRIDLLHSDNRIELFLIKLIKEEMNLISFKEHSDIQGINYSTAMLKLKTNKIKDISKAIKQLIKRPVEIYKNGILEKSITLFTQYFENLGDKYFEFIFNYDILECLPYGEIYIKDISWYQDLIGGADEFYENEHEMIFFENDKAKIIIYVFVNDSEVSFLEYLKDIIFNLSSPKYKITITGFQSKMAEFIADDKKDVLVDTKHTKHQLEFFSKAPLKLIRKDLNDAPVEIEWFYEIIHFNSDVNLLEIRFNNILKDFINRNFAEN